MKTRQLEEYPAENAFLTYDDDFGNHQEQELDKLMWSTLDHGNITGVVFVDEDDESKRYEFPAERAIVVYEDDFLVLSYQNMTDLAEFGPLMGENDSEAGGFDREPVAVIVYKD